MASHISITAGPVPSATVEVTLCGEHDVDISATKDAVRVLLAVLDVQAEDVPAFKARIRDAVLGRLSVAPPDDAPPHTTSRAPREPKVEIAPDGEARIASTGEKVTGETFYCPDCHQPAKPSVERYQEWEPGDDGRLYAQKWFCGNKSCDTKSLWRSKLVSR